MLQNYTYLYSFRSTDVLTVNRSSEHLTRPSSKISNLTLASDLGKLLSNNSNQQRIEIWRMLDAGMDPLLI